MAPSHCSLKTRVHTLRAEAAADASFSQALRLCGQGRENGGVNHTRSSLRALAQLGRGCQGPPPYLRTHLDGPFEHHHAFPHLRQPRSAGVRPRRALPPQ